MLFGVRILPRIISPIVTLAVMRLVGAAYYGAYSTVASLVAIIGALAEFGLGPAVLKLLRKHEGNEGLVLRNAMSFVIWSSAVAAGTTLAAMLLLGYEATKLQLGLVLSVGYFGSGLSLVAVSYLQHLGQYKTIARVELVNMILTWITTLPLAFFGTDLRLVFGLPVAAFALNVFLQYGRVIFPIMSSVSTNRQMHRSILREAGLVATGNMFYQIYYQADVVLLSLFVSESAVGQYAGAYRFISLAYLLSSTLFNEILYARYFEWRERSAGRYRWAYVFFTKVVLVAGTFVSLALFLSADLVVTIMLGTEYRPAVLVLRLLAPTIFLRFLASSFGAVLLTSSELPRRLKVQALAALVNVAVNLLVIPHWGLVGAAWSTLASETVVCGGYAFLVRRRVFADESLARLGIPVFALVCIAPMFIFFLQASLVTALIVAVTLLTLLGIGLWTSGYLSDLRQFAMWGREKL